MTKQSDISRQNAENCMQLAEAAKDHVAYKRFKRMEAAWLALAQEQDWLDGELSPVDPKKRAEGEGKPIRYGAKRPWTSEDDYRLRTLLESGASPAIVATKLKRTLTATKGRASLLGISFRQIKLRLKTKGK
jgi:hypothetical protein